jgi:hypothetical protein
MARSSMSKFLFDLLLLLKSLPAGKGWRLTEGQAERKTQVFHHCSSPFSETSDWKGMKIRVLEMYDVMSNNAIITLNSVPLGFVQC